MPSGKQAITMPGRWSLHYSRLIRQKLRHWMGAYSLRFLLICTTTFALASCGPFRPPNFDKSDTLNREQEVCVITIHGTWPNLPHDPRQWFVGGRTALNVLVRIPSSLGTHSADQIVVQY